MLGEENIIPPEDAKKIVEGLKGILADAREGKIQWSTEAEDIHMNVETLLIQRIGDAGKRVHTGRSRNDQCVLDTRMYARESCTETRALLDELIEQSVKVVGKPVALMNKEDKVKAVQFLNETGAFLITKSGDRVCKFFGISKYTLYSYIDESKA